jgi:hypothetical protein
MAQQIPPPTVPFDRLPTELKLQVLEILYLGTRMVRRDYTSALRVCREWNELGAPLLWTYIPINNSSVLPFIRSLEVARTTTSALVRNLSIRLSPLPSDSTATNGLCLTAASKQLATLIASRLDGLTSFSYQITKAPIDPFRHPPTYSFDENEQEGIFPLETAASLVDSLTASCSTVEFATFEHDHDATGSGSIRSTDSNCLCEALRR